jgi:hypothetical protein
LYLFTDTKSETQTIRRVEIIYCYILFLIQYTHFSIYLYNVVMKLEEEAETKPMLKTCLDFRQILGFPLNIFDLFAFKDRLLISIILYSKKTKTIPNILCSVGD